MVFTYDVEWEDSATPWAKAWVARSKRANEATSVWRVMTTSLSSVPCRSSAGEGPDDGGRHKFNPGKGLRWGCPAWTRAGGGFSFVLDAGGVPSKQQCAYGESPQEALRH